MILSSDELEILDYLKGWKDKFVPMVEICRRAGGRKRFAESPNWAKGLMSRLVEADLVDVNERGHYRYREKKASVADVKQAAEKLIPEGGLVDENYFPGASGPEPEGATRRWLSPEIARILNGSRKKIAG